MLAIVSCKSGRIASESEEVVNLIDHELDVEEPAKKKAKIINFEGIIMGEQLTDVEINFAQSLIKKQFPKLNGYASTLYQEKKIELSEASSAEQAANNTLQIKAALDCCINSKLSSWRGQSV